MISSYRTMIKIIALSLLLLTTSLLFADEKGHPFPYPAKVHTLNLTVIELYKPEDVAKLYKDMFKESIPDDKYLHGFKYIDTKGKCVIVIPHAFGNPEAKEFRFAVAGHELYHCLGYDWHK